MKPKSRTQPTQKTTLLLLSDTHSLTPLPRPESDQDTSFLAPLPESEILIHAGDLTKVSRRHEHLTTLAWLKSHPARLKLVIPGNHDITFDEPYYHELGHHRHRNRTDHTAPSAMASSAGNISSGKEEPGVLEDPAEIRGLYTSPEAYDAGVRLLGEGVHSFEIPGDGEGKGKGKRRFRVYASSWTPEFCQWAFGYERGVDRFNPSPSSASASASGSGGGDREKQDGKEANAHTDTHADTHAQTQTQTQTQTQSNEHQPASHEHSQHNTNTTNQNQNQPNETSAETRERTRPHGSTGSRGEGARGAIAANSARGFVAPHPIPDDEDIDIVITHGPPYGILDQVVPNHVSVGCEHLYRAVKRARPRLHVFGHIHEGYGAMRREWSTGSDSMIQCDAQQMRAEHCARVDVSRGSAMPLNPGQETLFVNACVVNVQYHPINAPWLVDLELPVIEEGPK
ncbi:uncharacterized protein BO97DRAFT_407360 [Aspergillus homomorphus CBS 101889]|uniref:Uncharacterized protein n=1 Tax=Aspergillus homomorphus (strain CBS 101889) TaxID=1450537 RepID=A0A395HUC4_ASPHC|nr:hypothetical protein BO97DRAFT_407360 [Aspergillus homomorphus CBS 101889]RAL09814.1 hypothetical protein BO97DRAFT_407360 [Aspergillus homomorphus CBS 101889]